MPAHSITCEHLGTYQVQVKSGERSWLADLHTSEGGHGRGPSPFEFLLSSLGACLIITVQAYAERTNIPVEGLTVRLDDEWVAEGSEKKYHVRVLMEARGHLSETDLARLLQCARRCPVHNVLSKGAGVEVELRQA